MGSGNDKKYLVKWGFKNRPVFEKYIQQTIEDLEFDAPRIFELFRNKVGEWENDYLKRSRKRFVAETIAPPQNKLIKSPKRIAQKIIDSWIEYDEWKSKSAGGKAPQKYDPKKFLTTMTDVVRFRVICNYLSDIAYVDQRLSGFVNNSCEIEIESRNDHIETPLGSRRFFDSFERHFKRYGKRKPGAFAILKELAEAGDDGLKRKDLEKIFSTSSYQASRSEFDILLEYLEHDFYIEKIKKTDRYRFANPILRDYWKKNQ